VRATRAELQRFGFEAEYREFFGDEPGREEMAGLALWWLAEPAPQAAP
jgi:hypothetical protein